MMWVFWLEIAFFVAVITPKVWQLVQIQRRERERRREYEQHLTQLRNIDVQWNTGHITADEALAALGRISQWVNISQPDPAANERARQLLQDILTPQEWAAAQTDGAVTLPSHLYPGRTYAVPLNGYRVRVFNRKGELTKRLCLETADRVPTLDMVAARVLLLRTDEKAFLAKANHFPVD